jgi:hypothetical protein
VIAVALLGAAPAARATPSTEIWIPSVDFQAFLVPHLNFDTYVRLQSEPNGQRRAPLWLFGPTIGILPWEKIQAEVGLDLIWQAVNPQDQYPIYFHAKVGTPEDAFFKWQPALALGIYNVGVKKDATTQDISYALLGRTIPKAGRFSFGYFYANHNVNLFPGNYSGSVSNHGFLAAWDRTMKEISPKLMLLVDYQGSQSWLGAVNFGFQWSFTDNISMILAYDLYTNRTHYAIPGGTGSALIPGRDTFTVQVDINLDRLVKAPPKPSEEEKPADKPGPGGTPVPASRPAASQPAK